MRSRNTSVASRRGRRLALAAALTSIVFCAGASAQSIEPLPPRGPGAAPAVEGSTALAVNRSGAPLQPGARQQHIVVFKQAPLALYEGGVTGLARPPRAQGRLDVASSESHAYLAYLEHRQDAALASISAELGRDVAASARFQHALNGMVLTLDTQEAQALRARADVALVEGYREYETTTNRGPEFIGAGTIWDGSANPDLPQTRGEGMVLGSIDSGINFLSLSLAATETSSGYVHVNPLGAGNYLGTCAPGGIDSGANRCSAKVIGAYDFVYAAVCLPEGPTSLCAAAGPYREEASAIDTNGHGTHTATTAAGISVNLNFNPPIGPQNLKGVAPHANIIAYDACYTVKASGQGLCPNVSTVAAINQAVADGIVDVLNYSIGGGESPWEEATSLAFLAAHNAGIFISASAGNSGPSAATVAHLEPWVHTVAASTHDGTSAHPNSPLTGVGDIMAGFSSRGPNPYAVLKPEITGPGVFIMAATAAATPAAGNYGWQSGTSMSAPHNAGAALLLRSLHPTWTPMQVKSALMNTAKRTGIVKEDGTTPSDVHDRGAGRIDLANAANVGLILDETGANFAAADPAEGGDPGALNLASYYNPACVGTCSFRRSVRSATGNSGSWTIAVSGLPAGSYTAPPSLLVGSTSVASFDLAIDATQLPAGEFVFGEVTLTSADPTVPVVAFPLGIRAEMPILALDTEVVAATVEPGESETRTIEIRNDGNPTLTWNADPATAVGLLTQQSIDPDGNGIVSSFATTSPANTGAYSTDDFTISSNGTKLAVLSTPGFTTGNAPLTTLASAITWRIWRDDAGLPDGKPESADVPLMSFTTAPNSAGVSVVDNEIVLDLEAAGVPDVVLDAGQYWLMVSPHVANINTRWNWYAAGPDAPGELAQFITPGAAFGNATGGEYVDISSPLITEEPDFNSLALRIDVEVPCGAPWMGIDGDTTGTLGLEESVDVSLVLDATGLEPGVYTANFCVSSEGTSVSPEDVIVPVTLTVPADPALSGSASPDALYAGESTTLSVTVVPGDFPPSTALAVVADLTSIGGSATQALASQGGNVFTFQATIGEGVAPGPKSIPVTVTDGEGRTASGSIALTVLESIDLAATGLATPASVESGEQTVLTVDVTPATGPASTGVSVTVDLTAVGGSATQALLDDGNGADATAGDGIYSAEVTVTGAPAAYTLVATVEDAQARSTTADIALEITAPPLPEIFADGFE